MKIEGEEVCDENGVCYAYSGATGTSLIPYSGDSEIYYQVIFQMEIKHQVELMF